MDSSNSPESVFTPAPEVVIPAPSQFDVGELKAAANDAIKDAKVKFEELAKVGHQYIKENPGKSVLAALGLGLVVGLVLKD